MTAQRGAALRQQHEDLKNTRQRGSEAPNHSASVAYLKALEAEMKRVQTALDEAWVWIDDSKNFRKCSSHMDRAQQRLHRVVKKISKRRKV